MELVKEKKLEEAHQKFITVGFKSQGSINDLDGFLCEDIMGFGTTADERIFSIPELKSLLERQREQGQGLEMDWKIVPLVKKILKGENTALTIDDVFLSIVINQETVQMQLRFTIVFEYINDKWAALHFHGSKPENTSTHDDTWGIEVWRKRNSELEELVKQRTADLEKSLIDLKATQAQLIQSEKMASLGELTAGIAHEIQNPLNFVNNFSEVNEELLIEMKDELDNGNIDEAKTIANSAIENQQKILHHGKRADSIVKGMLQHSRSSSGIKEPTDINALADEYLRLAYHGLRAKDKSFNAIMQTDFDETTGIINIIPQDIGRVVLNLITNAFYVVNEKAKQKINGYEPTVLVSTRKEENRVLITVKDNGDGIHEHIKEKIFQPFFTTKPTGHGTGLGLSMSYDIITKSHNGELKVETKEGEGSEFIIVLPA